MFSTAIKDGDICLAFLKSLNVQVFPCGRRRSPEINSGGDTYRLPFDPEARLNTEYNNRKHVGINNNQTFLDSWITDTIEQNLSLVMDGYVFTIIRDRAGTTNFANESTFAAEVIKKLQGVPGLSDSEKNVLANADKIYANIRIEKSPLLETSFANYKTWILRNQSDTEDSSYLDQPTEPGSEEAETYYFSGLSFSAQPLTGIDGDGTFSRSDRTATPADTEIYQSVISLCILDKSSGNWEIHQPALLPEIKHGDTDNSIIFGNVTAGDITAENVTANNKITANQISQNNKSVPSLQLKQLVDTYQLQFSNVDKVR